jgi:hypothetical protein
MPELTRKRVNNRPVTWHVHYAGVRVGVIVERSGAPPSSDQWQWCCGFYPGSHPATIDTAPRRPLKRRAWRSRPHGEIICPGAAKPTLKNGAIKEAWTDEKYRRFDRHERMPPDRKQKAQRRLSGV